MLRDTETGNERQTMRMRDRETKTKIQRGGIGNRERKTDRQGLPIRPSVA